MSFLNLSGVKENTFELLPEGEYTVICDSAEVKDTKSGTGAYINAKMMVTSGPYEGRSLFTMFNIKNDAPKAAEIGLAQLKTFLKCAGQSGEKLESVSDLIGLTANAVVKHKTDSYGEKANISYFKPAKCIPANEVIRSKGEDVPF